MQNQMPNYVLKEVYVQKKVKKDIIENLNNELEGYTIAGYPEELLKLFAKI